MLFLFCVDSLFVFHWGWDGADAIQAIHVPQTDCTIHILRGSNREAQTGHCEDMVRIIHTHTMRLLALASSRPAYLV